MSNENKKSLSTFEREMKSKKFKTAYDKSYRELLLSELLISMMEEDDQSVRSLAQEIGLSPTIIQNIRSGKQEDLKASNFVSLVQSCGYKVILEKNHERIEVLDKKVKNKHSLHFVWSEAG